MSRLSAGIEIVRALGNLAVRRHPSRTAGARAVDLTAHRPSCL
jgi:hypothetical protein